MREAGCTVVLACCSLVLDDVTSPGPPQYGRCGTLFWSPPLVASSSSSGVVVVLDERSAGRFSLSSVTDLKSGKHTAVLRSTACNAISQQLCFSLVSSQQELNLQFNSTADKGERDEMRGLDE